MELLRGRNLAQIIADEPPLSPPRMVDLLGQALAALDEAHAAGVVHRDFKPENIFVETLRTGKEHVKVLDFGIAKLRGEADANLTSRGAVCGTPDYMSPEQIRGEELDARSDVYAAGVVLYEAMTGTRPFERQRSAHRGADGASQPGAAGRRRCGGPTCRSRARSSWSCCVRSTRIATSASARPPR